MEVNKDVKVEEVINQDVLIAKVEPELKVKVDENKQEPIKLVTIDENTKVENYEDVLIEKEKHVKYMKNYYSKNKKKLVSRAKEKVKCDLCLLDYNYSGKNAHLKSKKHLNGIKIVEEVTKLVKKELNKKTKKI